MTSFRMGYYDIRVKNIVIGEPYLLYSVRALGSLGFIFR